MSDRGETSRSRGCHARPPLVTRERPLTDVMREGSTAHDAETENLARVQAPHRDPKHAVPVTSHARHLCLPGNAKHDSASTVQRLHYLCGEAALLYQSTR